MSKICKTCKIQKDFSNYGISKKHKDGYLASCKTCEKKKKALFYKNNPESLKRDRERTKKWKKQNKDRVKYLDSKYRKKNRKKLNKKSKERYRTDKESILKHKRKYEKNNPHIRAKIKTKRRMAERKAIPDWSETEKIKTVYKKAKWLGKITGLKYHVDHIVPIQGKDVCGLHVWANLQILEVSINCSKQDKYDKKY